MSEWKKTSSIKDALSDLMGNQAHIGLFGIPPQEVYISRQEAKGKNPYVLRLGSTVYRFKSIETLFRYARHNVISYGKIPASSVSITPVGDELVEGLENLVGSYINQDKVKRINDYALNVFNTAEKYNSDRYDDKIDPDGKELTNRRRDSLIVSNCFHELARQGLNLFEIFSLFYKTMDSQKADNIKNSFIDKPAERKVELGDRAKRFLVQALYEARDGEATLYVNEIIAIARKHDSIRYDEGMRFGGVKNIERDASEVSDYVQRLLDLGFSYSNIKPMFYEGTSQNKEIKKEFELGIRARRFLVGVLHESPHSRRG